MLQDLNPNVCKYMLHVRLWLFSFIGHAKDKEVYTMQ